MLKLQKFLMASFVFLVPVIWPIVSMTGPEVRPYQEAIFQYLAMIVCSFFVGNLWLGLFMTWAIFLFWLNGADVGHSMVFNIFLGIVLFGVSRKFFKKVKFDLVLRPIIWICAISAIFMILQHFAIDPLHSMYSPHSHYNEIVKSGDISKGNEPWTEYTDPVGIGVLKAHNGIIMSLLIPILASVHPLLGLVGFYPIYLSDSSAAFLGAILSFLFYLWAVNRKWFKRLLIVGVIGLPLFILHDYHHSGSMFKTRLPVWHATIKTILFRPIGYGPDSFNNFTPYKNFLFINDHDDKCAMVYKISKDGVDNYRLQYYSPNPRIMKNLNDAIHPGDQINDINNWDHPHNEILAFLFMFGIPGGILAFMFFRDLWIRVKNFTMNKEMAMILSMLIVYAAGSITQFPLSVARTAFLFPLLLGAIMAITDTHVTDN